MLISWDVSLWKSTWNVHSHHQCWDWNWHWYRWCKLGEWRPLSAQTTSLHVAQCSEFKDVVENDLELLFMWTLAIIHIPLKWCSYKLHSFTFSVSVSSIVKHFERTILFLTRIAYFIFPHFNIWTNLLMSLYICLPRCFYFCRLVSGVCVWMPVYRSMVECVCVFLYNVYLKKSVL